MICFFGDRLINVTRARRLATTYAFSVLRSPSNHDMASASTLSTHSLLVGAQL